MINGLYSACSGMYTQQIRLDVVSSNVANAGVPGFKGEQIAFSSFPVRYRIQEDPIDKQVRRIGPLGGGAMMDEITTNYAPGQMQRTGQDSDLAIFGDGYFHLDTPTGERLTRNGSFLRDSEGYLRNSDGNLLLGEKGPIQVPESQFIVSGDGSVLVKRETSTPDGRTTTQPVTLDKLKVTVVDIPQDLERQGNSLYFLPSADEQPADWSSTQIGQGFLEASNVSAIEESIKMIDTFRAYEASQRLARAVDDTLDQVIHQVGGR